MQLNKKKSGIVIFAARRIGYPLNSLKHLMGEGDLKKKYTPTSNTIEGVPICDKYKYLGTNILY